MPGSGIKAFPMVDNPDDFADPLIDGEDDGDMDMEVIYEAMKHVPLPDIDYPGQHEPISMDFSLAEAFPSRVVRAQPHAVAPQGVLKRKVSKVEKGEPTSKGTETGRVPKRLKVQFRGTDTRVKASSNNVPKAEVVTGAVTSAAGPPVAFAAGVLAEVGPRPDFSLWTMQDDLLLKSAMEAGAAMEALAKGAMRFSRRFNVRELRERWRALLYDPEVAVQASARMAEAECGTISKPKNLAQQKNSDLRSLKKRANSIRNLYYKQRRKVVSAEIASEGSKCPAGSKLEDVCAPESDVPAESGLVSLHDPANTGSASPKQAPSPDIGDGPVSQMFSLLAFGGVRAVVGGIPGLMSAPPLPDQGEDSICEDRHDGGTEFAPSKELDLGHDSEGVYLAVGNGSLTHSGSPSLPPMEPGNAQLAQGNAMDGSSAMDGGPANLETSPVRKEDSSAGASEVDGNLQPSEDCSKLDDMEAEHDGTVLREGGYGPAEMSATSPLLQVHDVDRQVAGAPEEHSPSVPPLSLVDPAGEEHILEVKTSLAEDMLTGNPDEVELMAAEEGQGISSVPVLKSEHPCATDLASEGVHGEILNAEEAKSCPPLAVEIDTPKLQPEESMIPEEERPCLNLDDNDKSEMKIVDPEVDICSESPDDKCYLSDTWEEWESDASPGTMEEEDQCCSDESCSYLDCACEPGSCGLRNSDVGLCVLEPTLCILNTEDTEVPILDDTVLPLPSPLYSGSDEGMYEVSPDSPYAGEGWDGYADSYPDEDFNGHEDAANASEAEPAGIVELGDAGEAVGDMGSPVDRNGGKIPTYVHNGDEEDIGMKCEDQLLEPLDGVDDGASCMSPTVGELHRQLMSQGAGGDDSFQAVDFGVTGQQHSPPPRDTNMDASPPPSGEVQPKEVLVSEPIETNGEAHKSAEGLAEEDEIFESEEEMARFSDVEAMILDMDLDAVDGLYSARAESRRMYRRHGRAVVRAEQCATAGMQRTLKRRGAFAIFYGLRLKCFLTKTEVLVGRATADNVVDVDLGKEGRANKVSRHQANIKLKDDGVFYLRNLGRRGINVNNKPVETGQRAILGSNCLIEVGGMRFIFESNRKLVQEYILRRHQRHP